MIEIYEMGIQERRKFGSIPPYSVNCSRQILPRHASAESRLRMAFLPGPQLVIAGRGRYGLTASHG